MAKRIPILIVLSFLVFFSCRKDKNIGSPTVNIYTPAALNTYNVFDTVAVKANVSDAVSLQSVSVYLMNSQGTQVLPSYPVAITSVNMTFTCYYMLNDVHLPGGQYTIVVRAYNGTNATQAYRTININAAPLKTGAIYAITHNNSGVHAWQIDTAFNTSLIYTQSGDYSSAAVSSYYQQLYIAAADSGNVNAVVPSGASAWSVPGLLSVVPYFTNVYTTGDAVYISYYKGFVKNYNHSGVLQSVINTATGYYPVKSCQWSNYLFVEEKNIASLGRNLVLYYPQSGIGYEQNTLPGPVVALYGMDNDHLFVFGNTDSGSAYMQLFSISGNIYYSPLAVLPAGKIFSVAQVNPQTYLIGFDNGSIYLYTYNPNSMALYVSGVVAAHMQYDNANNKVIAAAGKNVYEYDYTSSALIHSANMQDSVMDVQVLYNK